jgi:hypothetical protein
MRKYFTDYPVEQFGDRPGYPAPIRPCVPVSYDGNKYVICDVKQGAATERIEFKSGYLYRARSHNPKRVVRHRHLTYLEEFEPENEVQAIAHLLIPTWTIK